MRLDGTSQGARPGVAGILEPCNGHRVLVAGEHYNPQLHLTSFDAEAETLRPSAV